MKSTIETSLGNASTKRFPTETTLGYASLQGSHSIVSKGFRKKHKSLQQSILLQMW